MLVHPFDDTIAAVSTPPGQSGIGIVRISGPDALPIADRLFRPASDGHSPSEQPTFSTRYGRVYEDDEVVDEVILTVMRAPRTYTTQDVVEINCHGGIVPLRRVLELVLHKGARLADPGEFTKRAFFFGRIDLAQAEAVADTINARTEAAHKAALHHLAGKLSQHVRELRDRLMNIVSLVEASIDFVEDDIDFLSRGQLEDRLAALQADMGEMLSSAEAGRALREGLRVAIAGRPNVGKSSLMNALLREKRVIVTPEPGTTRDVVEETANLGGFPVALADMAGLREADNLVERAGVDLAREWLDRADLILLVIDGSEPLRDEDRRLLEQMLGPRTLLVLNKIDLPEGLCEDDVTLLDEVPVVRVSALTGEGLPHLENAIVERTWGGQVAPAAEIIVTNVRHKNAIERAAGAIDQALGALSEGAPEEVLAEYLRAALNALGEITGDTATDDIINHIFDSFCIGK